MSQMLIGSTGVRATPQIAQIVDTNNVDIQAAPGVGNKIVVRGLTVSNHGTNDVTVEIRDATTKYVSLRVAANGGTVVVSFAAGVWALTANQALTAVLDQTGNVWITAFTTTET